MSAPRRVAPAEPARRGWCPSLARPMPTGDGLLARVHPPLGRLRVPQLRAVAEAALRHGNGHVDVTARGNLQIRGVREATAGPLAAMLAAQDLGDVRADGGPQRLTLTSPLAGAERLALAAAIEAAGLAVAGLPAKTLVAVAGPGVSGEDADVVLAPAADGRIAIVLAGDEDGLAVSAERATEAVAAMLRGFVAAGARRVRDLSPGERASLRHSAQDAARVHAAGHAAMSASRRVESPPIPPGASHPHPHPEVAAGLVVLGARAILTVEPPFGRCTAAMLEALAEAAEALDCPEIRTSPSRGFVLAAGDGAKAEGVLRALAAAGFVTRPDDPRRAVAACPGAPACASGSTPVPAHAARLAEAFAPLAARGLAAHVSGCAKGCARPGPADLTLVAEAGLYRLVVAGAPSDPGEAGLTFEAALERVRRADVTLPPARGLQDLT